MIMGEKCYKAKSWCIMASVATFPRQALKISPASQEHLKVSSRGGQINYSTVQSLQVWFLVSEQHWAGFGPSLWGKSNYEVSNFVKFQILAKSIKMLL